MTFEERRLKLVQFNTDWKYPGELEFLKKTLDIRQGESVLDYGCGLGTAVKSPVVYRGAAGFSVARDSRLCHVLRIHRACLRTNSRISVVFARIGARTTTARSG